MRLIRAGEVPSRLADPDRYTGTVWTRALAVGDPPGRLHGACRNSCCRLQTARYSAGFYASLTSESPKQNPSIRFCV